MEQYRCIVGENTPYPIEAIAIRSGKDLSVTIGGGTHYHIGAVALGSPRPIKDGKARTATVSVLSVFEHKDDVVARMIAEKLATKLNCQVSVSVGIHIDNATEEDIRQLVNNATTICQQLIDTIFEK